MAGIFPGQLQGKGIFSKIFLIIIWKNFFQDYLSPWKNLPIRKPENGGHREGQTARKGRTQSHRPKTSGSGQRDCRSGRHKEKCLGDIPKPIFGELGEPVTSPKEVSAKQSLIHALNWNGPE
jgi:hypothetical protein